MEQAILFSALSEAILYSIFHGLLVYAFVKLIIKVFSELPSSERYKILYTGMIWIFVSFIFSFSDAYQTGLENVESNVPLQAFEQKVILAEPFKSESLIPGFSRWIAILYFAGLITQSAMLLFGLFRINKIRKKSLRKVDFRWNSQLSMLSKKLNLEKKVTLSICNDALIPCTIGFIKPIILFPIAIINSLSPAEVEAILLHELAHIQRKDYLFNIIQRIMEMVLFFNPVIWFIGKEIRKEREYCCDDLVLQNTSNPVIYAQALLQIAENKTKDLSLSLSASGADKYSLFNRVKRLTNMKTMISNPKPHLFTSLTVVAVCLSLAWIIPAEQIIKQQKNKHKAFNQSMPDTIILAVPAVPNAAEAPSIAPAPPIHTNANFAPMPLVPKVPTVPLSSVLREIPRIPAVPNAAGTPSIAPAPPIHTNANFAPVPTVPLRSVPREIPRVPEPNAIPFPADTNKSRKKMSSAEWEKHTKVMKSHADEMKKHFESPEWKRQVQNIKAQSEEMKKHFESPEWKKQIADMKVNAEEMKNHALAMKKEFNSPEWMRKIEDMKYHSSEMKKQFNSPEWKKKIDDMKITSEELRKQFDSPEWKKKIEEMKINSEDIRKQFDSPEWRKQIEDITKKSLEIEQEFERVEKKKATPKN